MKDREMQDYYFEDFLKEAADKFTMLPSNKLWKGIYNNIHPGRKYPSFPTTMLMVFLLFFVGLEKNNNLLTEAKNKPSVTLNDFQKEGCKPNKISNTEIVNNTISLKKAESQKADFKENSAIAFVAISTSEKKDAPLNGSEVETDKQTDEAKNMTVLENPSVSIAQDKKENLSGKNNLLNDLETENDNEWKENYAFANLTSKNKGYNNLNLELYATPSVGFRSIYKTTDKIITVPSLLAQSNPSDLYTLRHLPGLNIEAGGLVSMGINKIFRLKAGMQVNYSGYQVIANNEDNTVSTYLQLKEHSNGLGALVSRKSNIENVTTSQQGEIFSNSSYQISIPLGTEFVLAENSSFEWSAGATVMPSYIFGGNPFLISADMKNYVNDESMMRKWNVNAGLETLLSYKLKNGSMLNAGPQLRYQLFSSYDSRYIYNEKLYNLGLKFGITKKL